MNRVIQLFFLILLPFYPLWAWLSIYFLKKPVGVFVTLILIPVVLYYLIIQKIKIPKYLIFLILFTIYHVLSTLLNQVLPPNTGTVSFLLSDANVLACLIFIVIESVQFDEGFIRKMTKLIFVVIIISLIVSLIQIKYPYFFISSTITGNIGGLVYLEEQRCFSIFSWVNLNSLGVSFPILIAILISVYHSKKKTVFVTIIIGIVVAFLTRARYVMISTIIVMSQLFFNSMIAVRKKVYTLVLFAGILIVLVGVASLSGYNIQQVIDNRILEKDTGMGSAKARIVSYEVFLLKFPENPWFGVGPETRPDVARLLIGVAPLIHVGYLSYLYYYGVFGSLLIFLSIFFLLQYAWMTGRKYAFWGSLYGLISFCFANTTFVYFNFSEMGVVLAVLYLKYYNDKSPSDFPEHQLI